MSADSKFLELAHARFRAGLDADEKQRKREQAAIAFYNGEQWDDELRKSRLGWTVGQGTTSQIVPARPTLTINKTREPVRQILNQERQSELGAELVPADDWGDTAGQVNHDEIKVREGLIRRIQRDSEAADARSWAFERGVIAGRGYYLVLTRYADGKTRNQEVYVQKIYNQASVVVDPSHEQTDGSDAQWFFVGNDRVPWDQYVAEYGTRDGKKNRVADEGLSDGDWRALGDEAPDWFTTDETSKVRYVRIVDYYYINTEGRILCEMVDGTDQWEDELPKDVDESLIQSRRTVVEKQYKWAKIDGCTDGVLEKTDLLGHYLPLVKVVGEEMQPAGKERSQQGVVEPMMDSCRGFNYISSKFVERIGLTPIPPWMMAAGQDEGFEDEYNNANIRALSRLHYNQKDSDGTPAPPPFRPDVRAEVADLGAGLQMFNEAIVSTSRVPETALGHVDPSVKSGKLAKALIDQSDQGTSNYLDNLRRSMRHEARIINDLLYPVYGQDPKRILRMMDASGKMDQRQGPGFLTPDAEFNVAVSITKNSATRRQQAANLLLGIVEADPSQIQIMGDLLWKMADAPEHEELEKRYRAVLAPPVQAVINGGPQQLPPQAQQQMAQMQAQIQHLQQLADKNSTDLQKTHMQEQGDTQRQQASDAVDLRKAEIAASASMANAQAKVDAENFRSYVDALQQDIAKKLDLHLQHVTDAISRQHDHETQARDQMHDAGMARLAHEHALEQSQQAADVASQQMAQQAALQPEPAEGA